MLKNESEQKLIKAKQIMSAANFTNTTLTQIILAESFKKLSTKVPAEAIERNDKNQNNIRKCFNSMVQLAN